MRLVLVVAVVAAVALSACTAGGVAVQGPGFLVPASGFEVSFHKDCVTYSDTTTSQGRFVFMGHEDIDQLIPTGTVFVTVDDPSVPNDTKLYRFNHVYDNTCSLSGGSSTQCVKYLFMLTSNYDELSANAPDDDVKVKLPESPGSAAHSAFAVYNSHCNIK